MLSLLPSSPQSRQGNGVPAGGGDSVAPRTEEGRSLNGGFAKSIVTGSKRKKGNSVSINPPCDATWRKSCAPCCGEGNHPWRLLLLSSHSSILPLQSTSISSCSLFPTSSPPPLGASTNSKATPSPKSSPFGGTSGIGTPSLLAFNSSSSRRASAFKLIPESFRTIRDPKEGGRRGGEEGIQTFVKGDVGERGGCQGKRGGVKSDSSVRGRKQGYQKFIRAFFFV